MVTEPYSTIIMNFISIRESLRINFKSMYQSILSLQVFHTQCYHLISPVFLESLEPLTVWARNKNKSSLTDLVLKELLFNLQSTHPIEDYCSSLNAQKINYFNRLQKALKSNMLRKDQSLYFSSQKIKFMTFTTLNNFQNSRPMQQLSLIKSVLKIEHLELKPQQPTVKLLC